jgi:hypothetical protein
MARSKTHHSKGLGSIGTPSGTSVSGITHTKGNNSTSKVVPTKGKKQQTAQTRAGQVNSSEKTKKHHSVRAGAHVPDLEAGKQNQTAGVAVGSTMLPGIWNKTVKSWQVPKALSEGDELRTLRFSECFVVILNCFEKSGFESEAPYLQTLLTSTVQTWIEHSGSIPWNKYIKYKLAAFTAAHLDQTNLPPPPGGVSEQDRPDALIGGRVFRWFKSKKKLWKFLEPTATNDSRLQASEFFSTLLSCKSAFPQLEEEDRIAELEATFTKLTTPEDRWNGEIDLEPIGDWGDFDEDSKGETRTNKYQTMLSEQTVQEQIQRTVRELFEGVDFSVEEKLQGIFPSSKANYTAKAAEGGGVGVIMEAIAEFQKEGGYIHIFDQDGKRILGDESRLPAELDALRERSTPETGFEGDVEERETDQKGLVIDYREFDDVLSAVYATLKQKALREPTTVSLVGLFEPLKIRIISKGPPIHYHFMQSMRRKIFRTLRSFPQFAFIGEVDTVEKCEEVLGLTIKKGEVYVSGDYKAATNEIRKWGSEAAVDTLSNVLGLDAMERQIFFEGLTQHRIESGIPREGGAKEEAKPQVAGQLMGSTISFVILCIINFAMCRWALEVAQGATIKAKDARLLINGDDCVFKGPQKVYDLWKKITAVAGLKESVGKTYVSDVFYTINSRMYFRNVVPVPYHEIVTRGGVPTPVQRFHSISKAKLFNFGIMQGLHEKFTIGSMSTEERLVAFCAAVSQIERDGPPRLLDESIRWMMVHHKKLLRESRLPYTMPRWLGGLGLPLLEGSEHSALDLKIARAIILDWKREKPVNLSPAKMVDWKVRTLATRQVKGYTRNFHSETDPSVIRMKKFVGRESINLLLTKGVTLATLVDYDPAEKGGGRALNINRRLWDPKKGRVGRPLGPKLDVRLLDGTVLGEEGIEGVELDTYRPGQTPWSQRVAFYSNKIYDEYAMGDPQKFNDFTIPDRPVREELITMKERESRLRFIDSVEMD